MELECDHERNSPEWKQWREGDGWKQWTAAMAPAVAARRRAFSMLRNKEAVELLFDVIAERYEDRPGGYTRILRLAKPRLGDAGAQAILELVGERDRVTSKSEKPAFVDQDDDVMEDVAEEEVVEEEVADEATDGAADAEASAADEEE